jgi:general secretion pathway protein D
MHIYLDLWRTIMKSWGLYGILSFLVIALAGCASTAEVASPTPPPPQPRQVPVRVSPPSYRPAPKLVEKEKVPAEIGSEAGMERWAARLKGVSRVHRRPAKGEKVYPIDLNLKNADLVEAVRVLMDTMGLNYTVDPKVKGTVSVRASGKLSQGELLSIMDTLLALNGATMIKGPNLYKIVPSEKGATRPTPVYVSGPVPPGMRTQVVFLEQSSAKEMAAVLKPLVSPSGSVTEASHNALVLVDEPENLDKLLELIHLVDTRGMAQTLVRLVKVQNTDPGEIIKECETIFSAYGTLAQKDKGKFGVSFMPVSRLDSVMILATSGALLERAIYWVKQLDRKTDMLANVHIYNVENSRAKNLADILSQVYGGAPSAPKVKETKTGTSGMGMGMGRSGMGGMGGSSMGGAGGSSMGGSSMGGMGGSSMGGAGMGGLGSTLGGALGAGGASGATGGGTALGGGAAGAALKERAAPAGEGGQPTSLKEGVRIIPDEENNLLVVVAPPYEWKIISRILKQLDIVPRQVMCEVLIAEVTLTGDLKYGLEFKLGQKDVPATTSTSTSGTTTGTTGNTTVVVPTSTTDATTTTTAIVAPASAAFAAAGGLTFVAQIADTLKGFINLLASENKVNILASPTIMGANNQEAYIQIGEDVPIKTSESVPLITTQAFSTSTVQYRSTGIILGVKPQINAKGLVTLEITQEVSNALPVAVGETSPRISMRQAKTSLVTGDNQTVVLGGLIREDKSRTSAGIPGLRRMPVLGPLFGSEGWSRTKTELIVLITPHVVNNLEEGARITQEMKEKTGLHEIPQQGQQPSELQRRAPAAGRAY